MGLLHMQGAGVPFVGDFELPSLLLVPAIATNAMKRTRDAATLREGRGGEGVVATITAQKLTFSSVLQVEHLTLTF